jgi:hypothetical protein
MQILQKENGRNKLVKSIGSAVKEAEFVLLESKAC